MNEKCSGDYRNNRQQQHSCEQNPACAMREVERPADAKTLSDPERWGIRVVVEDADDSMVVIPGHYGSALPFGARTISIW